MPRKRKADEEEEEDANAQSQGSAVAASPLSAEETEKLANELCRYVLLREHTKKPIARSDAKKAVLKDRPDGGGKIMKALLARANEKLLELAGIELVPAIDKEEAAGADDVGASQGDAASQGASQSSQGGSSQGGKAAGKGGASFVLVNRLEAPVTSGASKQAAEYHALVEVVLQLLAHGEGHMEESAILDHWLATKLRVARDLKLPNQRLSVGELVTKTMVSEAFLKRSKNATSGEVLYAAGPRAGLSRDAAATDSFVSSLTS